MSAKLETPFDNMESALEYTNLLLEATKEARAEVEAEIALATDQRMERRKHAFQLASYKLVKLSSHLSRTHRILNDLRMLRRLLMEERKSATPGRSVAKKREESPSETRP